MKEAIIINTVFSVESSPPSINTEIFNIKSNMNTIYEQCDCFDMDSDFYSLKGKETYDLLLYLLGGFPFSFPLNSYIDSNIYPFETFLTGNLILELLSDDFDEDALETVTKVLNVSKEDSKKSINKFIDYITDLSTKLKKYKNIYFYTNSICSVIVSLIVSNKISNNKNRIVGIGKNYFIKDLKPFIDSLNIIDEFYNNKISLFNSLGVNNINNHFDFSAIDIKQYSFKYGIPHVFLESENGCPNKCSFCSIRKNWDEFCIYDQFKPINRNLLYSQVYEIYEKLGTCFIHFGECTFNANPKSTINLLNELKKIPMIYSCNMTINNVSDSLIVELKKARFHKIIFGLESVNIETLKKLNKCPGKEKEYIEKAFDIICKMNEVGIEIQLNILLFYPGQTTSEVKKCITDIKFFINELNKRDVHLSSLPIGTLCLNYPSKMYYEVLNNPSFFIVYQRITKKQKERISKKIQAQFERIPKYAIDKINVSHIVNKMDFVNELKQYTDNNKNNKAVLNLLEILLSLKENIQLSWNQNKVEINSIKELKTNNENINEVILLSKNGTDINSIIKNDQMFILICYLICKNFLDVK